MHLPWLTLFVCTLTTLLNCMYAQSDNCCSLTSTELLAIDEHPDCPSGLFTSSNIDLLSTKCDECPRGTCRVDFKCFCPSDFVDSPPQNDLCKFSFGEAWPSSIGKEDTIWRSCTQDLDDEQGINVDDVCCSLTREQLEARVGTSNLCPEGPFTFDFVRELSRKCDRCPFGTCRVNTRCFCPKDFLESESQQELCRSSFTKSWNASVGLEDRHIRSCIRPSPPLTVTFDNCCLLSSAQLELRVGTNDLCPQFIVSGFESFKDLDNECDPCPFGTCRAGDSCFCPHDFLDNQVFREFCRTSFGEVYPDSIGREDSRCPNNPTPQVFTPSQSPSRLPIESDTLAPSTSPFSTPSPSTSIMPEPEVIPVPGSGSGRPTDSPSFAEEATPEGDGGVEQELVDSDNGLSGGAIAGIVIAVIVVVLIVLLLALFLWRKYARRKETPKPAVPSTESGVQEESVA